MFYKITFEADRTYYLDKNLYTEQQAISLAEDDWFDKSIPNIYVEEVEEEGD